MVIGPGVPRHECVPVRRRVQHPLRADRPPGAGDIVGNADLPSAWVMIWLQIRARISVLPPTQTG